MPIGVAGLDIRRDSLPETTLAPEPPIDIEERPPDLLHRILQHLRSRPTVQVLLAYGAMGWAALQFVALVAESHPSRPTVMITALVLYGAGFVVVALGAPVVLQGRHPLRSLMVVGVTVVSLGVGFVIRGLWSPPPDDPAFLPADSVTVPDDGVPTRSRDEVGPATGGEEPDDAPPTAERDTTAPDDPPTPPAGPDDEEDAPADGTDDPADAVDAVDPVRRILEVLGARYGDVDEVVEGTAARPGGNQILSGYDAPVRVRFYPYSGGYALNVDTCEGSERLDLSAPAAEAATVVTIPTECGQRRYTLAARREGETARIRIEVDSAAARRAVERARTLGDCRIEGGGTAEPFDPESR
ncbi:MAG: hypothetical protein RLN75_08040 [Longimicrobiales bacterium]